MSVQATSNDKIQDAMFGMPTSTNPENNPTVFPTRNSSLRVHTDASNFMQTYARELVADEMDSEMVVCDLATFQGHYLPFIPDEAHVDACIEYLETNGILVRDASDQRRWTSFESKPSELSGLEGVIFEPLNDIGVAITGYNWQLDETSGTDGVRQRCFTFKQEPNDITLSEINGSNHQVDGFFMPYGHSGPTERTFPTSDVAVAAEFKTKRTSANVKDNREKVVGAANHVMNNDPRRMFTYGMTIEDEQMTLWYFSRSHSAKSASFDFFADIRASVSVFLAFIFATEQEMGYDPTVHRCKEKGTIVYVYEVTEDNHTRYFKTTDSLSDYRSICITGRMTRVWEVIEVASIGSLKQVIGPPVVLKDLWLDQGAETERKIQSAIFEDIENFGANMGEKPAHFSDFKPHMVDELRHCFTGQAYKNYFLEIICDHQGHVSKPVPPSAKAQRGIFVFESSQIRMSSNTLHGSMPGRTLGDPTKHLSEAPTRTSHATTRTFVPKRQYRVVFKEVCKPLHHIGKLSDVIEAVRHCLVGLELLYCAGWVHRDISSGNLLLYELGGVISGKLADLEYARRFLSDSSSEDPKTGTPYFMPFEIQNQLLLFQFVEPDIQEGYNSDTELNDDLANALPPLQLRYNFQHDVESVWWIILWFLTARVVHPESQDFADGVFQNTLLPSTERRNFFLFGKAEGLQGYLHESLHPMARYITGERALLHRDYVERETARRLEELKTYSIVYRRMDNMLLKLRGLCDGVPDLMVPPQPTPVVSNPKRAHPSDNGDDGTGYEPGRNDKNHQDNGPPPRKRILRSAIHKQV